MSKNLRLFDPRDQKITAQQARRYALFEIGHTIVDFAAAFLFVIGSILFFFEQAMIPGTWCFLIGSIFFAAKPSIRLAREIWLAKLKNIDRLAEKAPEGPGSFQNSRATMIHPVETGTLLWRSPPRGRIAVGSSVGVRPDRSS